MNLLKLNRFWSFSSVFISDLVLDCESEFLLFFLTSSIPNWTEQMKIKLNRTHVLDKSCGSKKMVSRHGDTLNGLTGQVNARSKIFKAYLDEVLQDKLIGVGMTLQWARVCLPDTIKFWKIIFREPRILTRWPLIDSFFFCWVEP